MQGMQWCKGYNGVRGTMVWKVWICLEGVMVLYYHVENSAHKHSATEHSGGNWNLENFKFE